jgi:hypothetical protein
MPNDEENSAISAVHGVNHIFSSHHKKITRIFWIFAVFFSFCGFFFYLHNSWTKLMYDPEILIKTRERNPEDFPMPAMTICPSIFAQREGFNFMDFYNGKLKSLTDEECELTFSNLVWSLPEYIVNTNLTQYCQKEKLMKINLAETILNNAAELVGLYTIDDKFFTFLHRTSLSDFGVCYTINELSFSELFNTEVIHDDFKQFRIFLKGSNGTKEDRSAWSPDKGFQITNESDFTRLRPYQFLTILLKLTDDDEKNRFVGKHFKIFIHKPNEIVSRLNQVIFMQYDEVRMCLN